jgi:hypothetical protein
MRSAHYLSAPVRTTQILGESAVVAEAIARHQREATLHGMTEEAREMGTLSSGVYKMVLELTRPQRLSSSA